MKFQFLSRHWTINYALKGEVDVTRSLKMDFQIEKLVKDKDLEQVVGGVDFEGGKRQPSGSTNGG